MPASCGFSVKRVRRDVSFVAPYHGCNVQQQGGSFVLPLIIMGAPVQMSCPVTPTLPTVSCFPTGMVISLGARADTVQIKVDGSWQPLLLTYSKCGFTLDTTGGALVVTAPFTGSCWEIKDADRHLPIRYGDEESTLSYPMTSPTTAPTIPAPLPTTNAVAPSAPVTVQNPVGTPESPYYPFPHGKPWWHFPPYHPEPATAAPTAPVPVQDPVGTPESPYYPFPHGKPWWHFPPYHLEPATTAPVTVQDPVGTPESPYYPFSHGKPLWHFPPYHPEPATAAPTAPVTVQDPIGTPESPFYPFPHGKP
ncbi:uncharacterized protein LOC127428259 isoform X3 [Myxocyprinus asiaticus]|nr:uncharacterized protein LOC127428259 isoform X3 [Myxocyprinus asiaticus]